jgi:hypothetical protein
MRLALSGALHAGTLAGPITNSVNGHLYYLLTEDTWQNSEAQAIALGGHLTTIRDQSQQNWVFSTFASYGGTNASLWIGLRKVGGSGPFQWVSGEQLVYTKWGAGEPNNGGGGPSAGKEAYVHMMKTGAGSGTLPAFWNDLESPNIYYGSFDPIRGVVEVIPPGPTAMSIRVSQVEVCWTTRTNRVYQLQYSSELTTNLWTNLSSPLTGDGSSICVPEPIVPGEPQRFYRVVLLP